MSRSTGSWKPSSARTLCSSIAALALTACGSTTPASPGTPSPLVVASCPPRQPLLDDTFGSWMLKAQETGAMYDKCSAAALAGQPAVKPDYRLGGKLKAAP